MKFLFDNNLSEYHARALHELSACDRRVAQVIHLSDRFPRNTQDHVWISGLAREGGWIVISADLFNKNDLEREALRVSGLIVFVLGKGWGNESFWDQARNLVRWWPAIIDQSARIHGGAVFRVPWNFSGSGKFEVVAAPMQSGKRVRREQ